MDNIKKYDLFEIGKRIRKARDDKKLSQDEVGASLHTVRQTVSKWERGMSFPTLEDMLGLCNLFDCELSYLLCETEYKTKNLQGIASFTGLSEKAIHTLFSIKEKTQSVEGLMFPITDLFLSDEGYASLFFLQLAKLYLKLDYAVDYLESSEKNTAKSRYLALDISDQREEVLKAVDSFLDNKLDYKEIMNNLKETIKEDI